VRIFAVLTAVVLMACPPWWERLRNQPHPGEPLPPRMHADETMVGERAVKDRDVQALLDLTVRYNVIQNPDDPEYRLAEWVSVGDDGYVSSYSENPLIHTGLLLASLAVRDRQYPRESERTLMKKIIARMSELAQRTSEAGYILREDRMATPNGFCTLKENVAEIDRRWEPSSDEYSGLLVGLSFVYHYTRDQELRAAVKALSADIATYLRHHDYYLERPCTDGGLAWRGSTLIANAYAFEKVFESMGLGFAQPHFPTRAEFCARNQLPSVSGLQFPCDPMVKAPDELIAILDALQVPAFHDIETVWNAIVSFEQAPFLQITGSGNNVTMRGFAAMIPLGDPKITASFDKWYRRLQANNPTTMEPEWIGVYAYHGLQLREADMPLLSLIGDPNLFDGSTLPSQDLVKEWIYPLHLIAFAQGHTLAGEIKER
jgi:hypothetical protein